MNDGRWLKKFLGLPLDKPPCDRSTFSRLGSGLSKEAMVMLKEEVPQGFAKRA